jgi:S-adenosylmethionine decarboxylase
MILFLLKSEANKKELQQKNGVGVLEQRVAQSFALKKEPLIVQDNQEETSFGTFGRHIIADLSGCSYKLLTSVEFIQQTLENAVRKAGATIISSRFHQFSPVGVSGIILLSESHCSIHTWPDEQYAAIDIYTCGEHVFPHLACEYIAKHLEASEVCISAMERGLKADSKKHVGSYIHKTTESKILTH